MTVNPPEKFTSLTDASVKAGVDTSTGINAYVVVPALGVRQAAQFLNDTPIAMDKITVFAYEYQKDKYRRHLCRRRPFFLSIAKIFFET